MIQVCFLARGVSLLDCIRLITVQEQGSKNQRLKLGPALLGIKASLAREQTSHRLGQTRTKSRVTQKEFILLGMNINDYIRCFMSSWEGEAKKLQETTEPSTLQTSLRLPKQRSYSAGLFRAIKSPVRSRCPVVTGIKLNAWATSFATSFVSSAKLNSSTSVYLIVTFLI